MLRKALWFRQVALGLALIVFLSGCSYRRAIPTTPKQSGPPQGLTQQDVGRTVIVSLTDGTCIEGTLRAINPSRMLVEDREDRQGRAIPYEDVSKIEVRQLDRPGILFGTIIGGLVGLILLAIAAGPGSIG